MVSGKRRKGAAALIASALGIVGILASVEVASGADLKLERVTTIAPFPRGLAMVDGKLFVLARGCVRDAGGVRAEVFDRGGTLFVADPELAEPVNYDDVGEAVRNNGQVFAEPTEPPFKLWDRAADPPESDRQTDRPYCTLRYHPATHSFYICCFSGIDKPDKPGLSTFSKNLTDGLLRYDLRTKKWYEVERHNIEAGGSYPHHDVRHLPPPHGWLNGPDNCLVVGNNLYAVAKDNNVLVRYDLAPLVDNPEAGPPRSELILGDQIEVKGMGRQWYFGHSSLAYRDGYLYVGYRTSSAIVRFPLDKEGLLVQPIVGELVAQFKPYDPVAKKSANVTDIDFDSEGYLYVISASPARVYRFKPDPNNVYDARDPKTEPYIDLAKETGNPKMKCENILVDDQDRLFVTSGDGYAFQELAYGTVYRVTAGKN